MGVLFLLRSSKAKLDENNIWTQVHLSFLHILILYKAKDENDSNFFLMFALRDSYPSPVLPGREAGGFPQHFTVQT